MSEKFNQNNHSTTTGTYEDPLLIAYIPAIHKEAAKAGDKLTQYEHQGMDGEKRRFFATNIGNKKYLSVVGNNTNGKGNYIILGAKENFHIVKTEEAKKIPTQCVDTIKAQLLLSGEKRIKSTEDTYIL